MTQAAVRKVEPVARDAEEEGLTERIIIPVSKTMEMEIKDFWHDRRLNSKSEAVRALIQAGLDAERKRKR